MKEHSPPESRTSTPKANTSRTTPASVKATPEGRSKLAKTFDRLECEIDVNENDRANVFVSSVTRYDPERWAEGSDPLEKFRLEICDLVESRFPFLSVRINESPATRGQGSPIQAISKWAADCDVFVGILVGRYGCEDASSYSATHLEFIAAENNNPDKMLIFIESGLQKQETRRRLKLSPRYKKLLSDLTGSLRRGRMVKFFKSWEELAEQVVNQIAAYCANTLYRASHGPVRTTSRSPWELMTFTERAAVMRRQFKRLALDDPEMVVGGVTQKLEPDFGKGDRYRYRLTMQKNAPQYSIPVLFSVCPDRFSYPDAARYVGYPFRTRTDDWDDPVGPLDMVLLFRGITDTQIRRHLGNPDIEIAREGWGFFAVDPEQEIQVAYLTECDAPRQIGLRVRDFLGWLSDSGQWRRMAERARARGNILRAGHPSLRQNG